MDRKYVKHSMIFIILLSIVCYARIYLVELTFWDDNCWLYSFYNSTNIDDFLNAGFRDLRRTPIGIFIYYLVSLHKETNVFYPLFYTFTILIQIGTALFIYFLSRNVFRSVHLSFLVALIALLYPIDTTTPIFTVLPYRVGLLLSIISLYATAEAIREKIRWGAIAVSLLCAVLAQYIFVEGAVALEPARMLIIWHLLSEREKNVGRLRGTFFVIAGLFLLVAIPLVYYKLMYKPYGVYGGTYKSDPLFLLKWRMHRRAVVSLFFVNWAVFSKYLLQLRDALSPWSVVLGLAGALGGYCGLVRLQPKMGDWASGQCLTSALVEQLRQNRFVFILGLAFYIPPVLMYEFAGRVVFSGVDSRHGTLLVIGFALIWGGLFYALYAAMQSTRLRVKLAHALVAAFIGFGVFYHNVNHDLYLASQREQKKFWRSFTDRFPTLPDKSAFLFDVELPTYLYDQPFGTTFGIELYLNLLYAKSVEVNGFKNYIAAPISFITRFKNLQTVFAQRHPGTGHLFGNHESLYIVKYHNGKILVNNEIFASDQYIPYKCLLDKEFAEHELTIQNYPLRYKLAGFYR